MRDQSRFLRYASIALVRTRVTSRSRRMAHDGFIHEPPPKESQIEDAFEGKYSLLTIVVCQAKSGKCGRAIYTGALQLRAIRETLRVICNIHALMRKSQRTGVQAKQKVLISSQVLLLFWHRCT